MMHHVTFAFAAIVYALYLAEMIAVSTMWQCLALMAIGLLYDIACYTRRK